jgi:hypothetical protein
LGHHIHQMAPRRDVANEWAIGPRAEANGIQRCSSEQDSPDSDARPAPRRRATMVRCYALIVQDLVLSPRLGLRAHNGGLFVSPGHGTHPDRVLDCYELIFVRQGTLSLWEQAPEPHAGALGVEEIQKAEAPSTP